MNKETSTATDLLKKRAKIICSEVEQEVNKIVQFYLKEGGLYGSGTTYTFSENTHPSVMLDASKEFVKQKSDEENAIEAYISLKDRTFKFTFLKKRKEVYSHLYHNEAGKKYCFKRCS